ncbi:MAG: sulfite exporter TauE/SafE family protein [Gemmatimonadales bacterium]|nr:sulfite exporter TauE/SafE family protein [Gemmatimonadales bacterium]
MPPDIWFFVTLLLVAILAGVTASVVGFGIGSLLTPFMAMRYGTALAVAVVTLPHALATALRCWRLRASIDRKILIRFGLLSAAGALGGALVYTRLGSTTLTGVLGALLLLTAIAQLTGWSTRWQPHGPLVAIFGLCSGFFGGVAGNQGGLRAAALTTFRLGPAGFVAHRDGHRAPGRPGPDAGLPGEHRAEPGSARTSDRGGRRRGSDRDGVG